MRRHETGHTALSKVHTATAILRTRIRATCEFGTFSALLRLLCSLTKIWHMSTHTRVMSTRAEAAAAGDNTWFEPFRSHSSRKIDLMMMSSDTKQLPGGPTRHAARRAAASSLLCHGSNCCQPHEPSTLTKRKKCWHKIISKTLLNDEKKIIEEGRERGSSYKKAACTTAAAVEGKRPPQLQPAVMR